MPNPLKAKQDSANISLHPVVLAAIDKLNPWEFKTRSHYVHSLVVPDLQRRKLLPPSYPPVPEPKKRKR